MKTDFINAFMQTKEISEKYGLDTEKIAAALTELPDFKVTAPLVGSFSTGKSSLINAVLEKKLLAVNITPETAVPTEITTGNDTVTVTAAGGEQILPLERFDPEALRAETCSLVQIRTSDPFFQQIPTVKLVDMPGFDSGIEVHNRAIDAYMPRSLAYILAVSAEEGTLRESIIAFLNELKLYKVPVYVVITKSRKVMPEELENICANVRETVGRFMGIENVPAAVTNAKNGPVSVDQFQDILLELQAKSGEIYERHFTSQLLVVCAELEKYITDRLNQSDFTEEELSLEKTRCEENLQKLTEEHARLREKLTADIADCIQMIREKIQVDLSNSASTLEDLLLHGSSVDTKINSIVRSAIAITIQSRLEPKVQRYLRDVNTAIQGFVYGNTRIELDPETLESDRKLSTTLENLLTPAATAISTVAFSTLASTSLATALGLTAAVLGPIGAAAGAIAGAFISKFIGDARRAKQEEERRKIAQEHVQALISSVSQDAGAQVEASIAAYIGEITEKVGEELEKKSGLLRKALAGTEAKLQASREQKEAEKQQLNADLDAVRRLANGN